MEQNYLDEVIEELFDVICTSDTNNWPSGTSTDKKLRLLRGMLKYFENKDTREDYKKCSIVQRHVMVLELFKAQARILKHSQYGNTSGSQSIKN